MSEWVKNSLGELADFKKGKKVETSAFRITGYERYLGAGSLVGGHDGYASKYLSVIANENDVLMLWDGERSGLVGHNLAGVVSSTVTKLSPNGKIITNLLYYYLLQNFEWIQNRRTGTGVPHVPKDLSRLLKLNYPKEKSCQKKISSILESIDQAIEKTEALIHKYQQIKAGLMQDLFTRGITADGKLRPPREHAPELYKESPVGWIPREWEITTCSNVCEKIIDCKNRTPPITPDGFPVIRTPNVRNGEFVDDELVFTDFKSYQIWTKRGRPQVGDIVITREAPVGEVCMIPEHHPTACLGQRMMLYRPNKRIIDPTFFLFVLQAQSIQNRLDLISGGSTVGHVRVGDIRDLWIIKPKSSDEQKTIGAALFAIAKKIELEKIKKTKLKMQKSSLMHDLLTGKVQVKADKEEPAHV